MKEPRARLFCTLLLTACGRVCAQDNYEIQVYASPTVERGATMVELHSNYTVQGTTTAENGFRGSNHAWHETLEVTHGWNDWFETGFYLFSSITPGYGWEFVGTHLRPRVRAPESWGLPVGLSLSSEIGYQRPIYSTDTWSLEVRPIIDKQLGKVYLAFNPTVGKSLHGLNASAGWTFSPNAKASYLVHPRVAAGLEYYGSLGPLIAFDALRDQEQQILPALDLDLGPKWEFNIGVGVGVTRSTDHLVIKMILGRRFGRGGG